MCPEIGDHHPVNTEGSSPPKQEDGQPRNVPRERIPASGLEDASTAFSLPKAIERELDQLQRFHQLSQDTREKLLVSLDEETLSKLAPELCDEAQASLALFLLIQPDSRHPDTLTKLLEKSQVLCSLAEQDDEVLVQIGAHLSRLVPPYDRISLFHQGLLPLIRGINEQPQLSLEPHLLLEALVNAYPAHAAPGLRQALFTELRLFLDQQTDDRISRLEELKNGVLERIVQRLGHSEADALFLLRLAGPSFTGTTIASLARRAILEKNLVDSWTHVLSRETFLQDFLGLSNEEQNHSLGRNHLELTLMRNRWLTKIAANTQEWREILFDDHLKLLAQREELSLRNEGLHQLPDEKPIETLGEAFDQLHLQLASLDTPKQKMDCLDTFIVDCGSLLPQHWQWVKDFPSLNLSQRLSFIRTYARAVEVRRNIFQTLRATWNSGESVQRVQAQPQREFHQAMGDMQETQTQLMRHQTASMLLESPFASLKERLEALKGKVENQGTLYTWTNAFYTILPLLELRAQSQDLKTYNYASPYTLAGFALCKLLWEEQLIHPESPQIQEALAMWQGSAFLTLLQLEGEVSALLKEAHRRQRQAISPALTTDATEEQEADIGEVIAVMGLTSANLKDVLGMKGFSEFPLVGLETAEDLKALGIGPIQLKLVSVRHFFQAYAPREGPLLDQITNQLHYPTREAFQEIPVLLSQLDERLPERLIAMHHALKEMIVYLDLPHIDHMGIALNHNLYEAYPIAHDDGQRLEALCKPENRELLGKYLMQVLPLTYSLSHRGLLRRFLHQLQETSPVEAVDKLIVWWNGVQSDPQVLSLKDWAAGKPRAHLYALTGNAEG